MCSSWRPFAGAGHGLKLVLSQAPCQDSVIEGEGVNGTCCSAYGECATWSGAHLVTVGCMLYGTFTTGERWSQMEVTARFRGRIEPPTFELSYRT